MRWIWFLLAVGVSALAQTPPAPPFPRDAMRAAMEKQQAAAARQRESIRKQAENLGVSLGSATVEAPDPAAVKDPPPVKSASDPACDALETEAIAPIIEAAAKAQTLAPKLIRAVIEQESAYRPCATSAKGAKGLMQLMPDTALQLGVDDPFDPQQNIEAGARYLKQLLDKYGGNLTQALGAYNAGPGTVDQAGGVPNIRETQDYVKAIMQKMSISDLPLLPPPKI
jgi:soluble lytic murein transglycosylase-like protein